MARLVKILFVGLLLAVTSACFFYSPYGQSIEESLGLTLLYKLRGPRKPPDSVVIINVDDSSSEQPGAARPFGKWPRIIHAQLVDKLVHYGAKVIAFDIHFSEQRDLRQDLTFAEAIRRAGNVVLVEEMQHISVPSADSSRQSTTLEIDTRIPPVQPLAEAAKALAPFPLPKIPVRVATSWRFKSSCGDIPTLPSVVFQAATLRGYEHLRAILLEKFPGKAQMFPATSNLVGNMRTIREIFLENYSLRQELLPEIKMAKESGSPDDNLQELIAMYGGESNGGIDFYGPPATLITLSYHDILSSKDDPAGPIAQKIKGRVAFVGVASTIPSNQKDGFYTVFSQPNGLDLSGVELAATIFANLSENRQVHQPSMEITIVLLLSCAIISCLISFMFTPPTAGFLLISGGTLYLVGAHIAFSRDATWVPLFISLIFIPFAAFWGALLTNYLITYREKKNVSTALGLYLPHNVALELTKDLSFISKGDRRVYSTCLITDAEHYTTLSEELSPKELSIYMKEYYRYLFREVKKKDGLVCNIIGDSMLALWPSAYPDERLRKQGCLAALQIAEAVNRFNDKHRTQKLPTRIGLHSGYLLLDHIGAEDHFEYAPIGDIVNTVSRIEGLNKHLATTILASQEALLGHTGIESREVGLFLLSGKKQPIRIYELLGTKMVTGNMKLLYEEIFPESLALFQAGHWNQAQAGFEYCLILDAEDGPSRFYLQRCNSFLVEPPSDEWQGIISVGK